MSESPSPQSDNEEILEAEILDEEPSRPACRNCGTVFGRVILALLLVVLAIELHAKFGYERTLAKLRPNAVEAVGKPAGNNQPELKKWSMPLADAEKLVQGFPSKRRESLFGMPIVVLKWFTFSKKNYVIQLHLDAENTVFLVSTEDIDPS